MHAHSPANTALFSSFLLATGIIFTALPSEASAQETSRRAFVNQIKDEIKSFDTNKAFTQSRCWLDGITVSPNAIVIYQTNHPSVLELGDQIVGIADDRLSPRSAPRMVELLTSIAADATVHVAIIRNGESLTVQVPCQDALPTYTFVRRAYEAVTRGDFRGCVDLINQQETQFGAGSAADWLRYNCAYHAGYLRNPADWVMAYYEYLRRTIEQARWDQQELVSVRALVLANRQFFEDRGQLPLHQELQSHLDAAAGSDKPRSNREAPRIGNYRVAVASGTGFFVSPEGFAITSAHVIADANKITVSTSSGVQAEARVIAVSEATDLAILQVEHRPSRYLSLVPPRSTLVGTPVFTYGWPVSAWLGNEPKFTDGTISSLSGLGGDQSYLQISVPVQPGNSGGPLVNDEGQVVGVIASQAAIAPFLKKTGTLPQNINWAVKAEYAALLVDLPPRQPKTTNRAGAIELVGNAICHIRVEREE